jgi:hypothetical protein
MYKERDERYITKNYQNIWKGVTNNKANSQPYTNESQKQTLKL